MEITGMPHKDKKLDELLSDAFAGILASVRSRPWLEDATTEQLLAELKRRTQGGSDQELRSLTKTLSESEAKLEKAIGESKQTESK